MNKNCENQPTIDLTRDLPEAAAPPRKNGELQFQEPWESRAFGIALALYEKQLYSSWEDFRGRLIQEIGAWEATHEKDDPAWNYYERWLAALERLLVEKGLLDKHDIDTRAQEFLNGERDGVFL
jgi:nitrile hydratase accessory protein